MACGQGGYFSYFDIAIFVINSINTPTDTAKDAKSRSLTDMSNTTTNFRTAAKQFMRNLQ